MEWFCMTVVLRSDVSIAMRLLLADRSRAVPATRVRVPS
jgi:hypothetical protein